MQEVILMVGIQGSGKSFIAEQYLKRANYEVVSNDKSGGRDKVNMSCYEQVSGLWDRSFFLSSCILI